VSANPQEKHEEHIVPPGVYLAVFLCLLAGTALTIWVAFHDWGAWNNPIALVIATVKASLVVLYFMHLRYSPRLTTLVLAVTLSMMLVLMGMTSADYLTRNTTTRFYTERAQFPAQEAPAGAQHEATTASASH
jgi:cytochrome c oxidase subunit 4